MGSHVVKTNELIPLLNFHPSYRDLYGLYKKEILCVDKNVQTFKSLIFTVKFCVIHKNDWRKIWYKKIICVNVKKQKTKMRNSILEKNCRQDKMIFTINNLH